ncbi:MAG TPA: glycosyltransferase [Patescibacteria group bacterium]|nr:glycosyltransferase [Patescibacteria group bacterium]
MEKYGRKLVDLIYVGRLEPEKRLDTIIRTAGYAKKKRKKLSICVVGEGSQRTWFRRRVQNLRLSEYFQIIGPVTDPREYIRRAKILVLPSDYEALPTVILEAADLGVPSIISNFSGADEVVINEKTGWIVKNRSDFGPSTLAVLEDSRRVEVVGRAAKAFIREKYSSINIDQFIEHLIATEDEVAEQEISLVIPYWSLGIGGIETRIMDIAKRLKSKYPRVRLSLLLKRQYPIGMKLPNSDNLNIRYFSQDIKAGRQATFAWWCLKNIVLHQPPPTIILGFLNRFAAVAVISATLLRLRGRQTKAIISQESQLSAYLNHHEARIWKAFVPMIYNRANKILTLSNATKADLLRFGIRPEKVFVVNGWIPQRDEF